MDLPLKRKRTCAVKAEDNFSDIEVISSEDDASDEYVPSAKKKKTEPKQPRVKVSNNHIIFLKNYNVDFSNLTCRNFLSNV